MDRARLNDRQLDVLDRVLRPVGEERPRWERGFGRELREGFAQSLAEIGKDLPRGSYIPLNKYSISSVLTCEAQYKAADGGFTWDVPRIRGTIVHKAMELTITGTRRPLLDIAEAAIEDLAGEEGEQADWLRAMSPTDRHALVRDVNERLVKFESDFPPIPRAWSPRCESRVKIGFGPFSLRATPDLVLGRAIADEARVVVLDFKTGGVYPTHVPDAAFYSLAETLRSGTPPYRVGTYYLDSGGADVRTVDEPLLLSAMRRTLDAAGRLAELAAGRTPETSPGRGCWSCNSRETCEPGLLHLAANSTERWK